MVSIDLIMLFDFALSTEVFQRKLEMIQLDSLEGNSDFGLLEHSFLV